MFKVVGTYFDTRLKVLKDWFTIIKTFDQVPKPVPTTLNTRSKVFIMQNNAFKTIHLVIKVGSTDYGTRSKVKKKHYLDLALDLVPK